VREASTPADETGPGHGKSYHQPISPSEAVLNRRPGLEAVQWCSGKTALQLARESSHVEVVAILEKAVAIQSQESHDWDRADEEQGESIPKQQLQQDKEEVGQKKLEQHHQHQQQGQCGGWEAKPVVQDKEEVGQKKLEQHHQHQQQGQCGGWEAKPVVQSGEACERGNDDEYKYGDEGEDEEVEGEDYDDEYDYELAIAEDTY